MKRRGWGGIAILGLLLGTARAAAQEPGSVAGQIRDAASRAPVAGAAVTVGGQTVLADSSGRFRVTDLAVGAYILEAEQFGYRPSRMPDVMVRPSRITYVEVDLEVAAFELDVVTIRPSYFPDAEVEPGARFSYGAEELRRAPGSAGDVSRVMMSLPSVAKVNDQSNGLVVRGGSPLENAFVVDGIEIPNINHFPTQGASGGPIGLLNVDLIKSAELFAAAFPARYGDRLSSVVEIGLRDGNREEFDAQLDLSLAGFGGVVEGPLPGGSGSWVVSARRSYLDLVVELFDVGSGVAPNYGDYQGRLTLDAGRGHRISALAIWADDHNSTDLAQAREHAMLSFGNQDLLQGTTGVGWEVLWNDRVHSRTTVSHTIADFDESLRDQATDLPLLRNRSTEQWLRARHETRVQLPAGFGLRVGGDIARLDAEFDNHYFAHVGPAGDTVPGLAVREDLSGARWGLHVTAIAPLLPRLTATVGVRADGVSITDNDLALSPRASVAYRLNAATALSASVGSYRQTPPPVILAQSNSNRTLNDARALHIVASVSHLFAPDTRFTLEAYRKEYDRLPMDPDQPALFPLDELFYDYGFFGSHPRLEAKGVARSAGIEAVLRKRLSGNVYALAGAALVRARYRGLDGLWRNRAIDSRYNFSVEGGWRASDRWEASARWLFAGGPPYTPIDTAASRITGRAVLDLANVNQSRYPDYHSLNVRVDRRFAFRRSMLIAYLSVWNVYGRNNVAAFYWQPDENRVTPIRQWGMLPIFGLEYEF